VKTQQSENELYAQMGLATLIPGMQRMIELMQGELDKMHAQLARLQGASPRKVLTRGTVGRPRKVSTGATGWPSDPEERSREMRRRMKVRAAKKATHPRDPNHPGHAEWKKNVSAAAKKRWADMSFKARKERMAKMTEAKRKKGSAAEKPVVKLEVAS
jgi:hypothetical protein